jgi:hypothetical protein
VPTAAVLTVVKPGTKLVEQKHNPLANDLLFHPLDHIRDKTLDGPSSSLQVDLQSKPDCGTPTK